MKPFFLSISVLLFHSILFDQDTTCKQNKSYLQIQAGYANHPTHFKYKGEYVAVGYKYRYYTFLYLNAQATLINVKEGKPKNLQSSAWPTVQIKNVSIGTSGELRFFKHHSLEGGFNVSLSMLTRSIGRDVVSEDAMSYQRIPFHSTHWGYEGFAAYYYRFNQRLKIGFTATKLFMNDPHFAAKRRVNRCGLLLQLAF
jgi:hypothetical protein